LLFVVVFGDVVTIRTRRIRVQQCVAESFCLSPTHPSIPHPHPHPQPVCRLVVVVLGVVAVAFACRLSSLLALYHTRVAFADVASLFFVAAVRGVAVVVFVVAAVVPLGRYVYGLVWRGAA